MFRKEKVLTIFVLILVVLFLVPQFAQAKAKVIRAGDLRLQNPSNDNYLVAGQFIQIMSSGVELWAPVKLPRGATITGLQVWALDFGDAAGFVFLDRARDGTVCRAGSCNVATIDLSDASGQPDWVKLEDTTPTPGIARVKKGDRHYLFLSPSTGILVGTIKIFYKP